MATKDTKLNQLVLNILTKEQYEALTDKDENQLYLVKDETSTTALSVDDTYPLMCHHITIQGTSSDGYPFALCFTIKCPYNANEKLTYSKITSKEELSNLIELYSYQDICTGYYISFNVDVMSIGVNGFMYYQNSSVSTIDLTNIVSGISSISDILQTIPLVTTTRAVAD